MPKSKTGQCASVLYTDLECSPICTPRIIYVLVYVQKTRNHMSNCQRSEPGLYTVHFHARRYFALNMCSRHTPLSGPNKI